MILKLYAVSGTLRSFCQKTFLKNQIAGKIAMADTSIPALSSPVSGIFHRVESDTLCPFPKINLRSPWTGSILRIDGRFK
jgi:hypothetical protein